MAGDILRDVPAPVPQGQEHWGSDGIAAMLRALDIPYLALNPGASYRGLHDSIVNYLGNERPQMLLCLHEESAIAIAHGYARPSSFRKCIPTWASCTPRWRSSTRGAIAYRC